MKKVLNKTIKTVVSLSMIFMLMFGTVAPELTNWTGQQFGITESFAIDPATTFTFTNTTGINIVDGDKTTYAYYVGKVMWDGNLAGEVMEVNASGSQFLFKNASNQSLKFIDADTHQVLSGVILSAANVTRRFIIPEGAVYVDASGESSLLYNISIDGRDKPSSLENVTLAPSNNSIEVSYSKSVNVYEVAAYVDGVYHGRHTGSTVKLTALLSKQAYNIDLIPFTSDGVPGMIQKFNTSTLDDGVNFRLVSKTNTTGFKMLDEDKTTYAYYVGNITWSGNLAGEVMEVNASGSQFLFKNASGQNLKFIDADTQQVLSGVILSAANVTRRFIIPEGAVYVDASGESSLLYNISIDVRDKPSSLENVTLAPSNNSIEVGYTKPLNVYKVAAYVDGVFHGIHAGNNIKLNALLSKQTYSLELMPFTVEGVPGPIQKFSISTLDNGLNFRFPSKLNTTGFSMLDNDKNTSILYAGNITWDGNLAGKVIEIDMGGTMLIFKNASGQNLRFIDVDTKQIVSSVTVSQGSMATKRFVVPEGAILINTSGEYPRISEISIDSRDKPSVLENVSIAPNNNSFEVAFLKDLNVHEVAAYVDGVSQGVYAGSSIKLSALLSRQTYSIELVPFTSEGVPGPIQKFSSSTFDNGLNFRFPSKLNTTGFSMLDNDKNTSIQYTGDIKWDSNLAGEVIEITLGGATLFVRNASSQNINFIDADTKQVLSSMTVPVGSVATKRLIVPEGATQININGEVSRVYEISVDTSMNANNQALLAATNAVVKAESTRTMEDVNAARVLVELVATSTEKTALSSRLDVVQTFIDAETAKANAILEAMAAVSQAEISNNQVDIDHAKALVNALADSPQKAEMITKTIVVQAQIDAIKLESEKKAAVADAKASVEIAATDRTLAAISAARTVVVALHDCPEKTELTSRLDAIMAGSIIVSQEFKVADTKINLAMSLPREPYLSLALLAIEKVADPIEKASLVAEMQIVIEKSTVSKPVTVKTANLFIRLAEITGRDKYIALAETKTTQIVDESEKQDAIIRMDFAKLIKSPAEKRAYSALIAAEQWKSANMITAATKLIGALHEGILKTVMLDRVNKIN